MIKHLSNTVTAELSSGVMMNRSGPILHNAINYQIIATKPNQFDLYRIKMTVTLFNEDSITNYY